MSHSAATLLFCGRCGGDLGTRSVEGKKRPVCQRCDHVVFEDPKVAVVVMLTDADRLLLVKRRHEPARGHWALPGGFLDSGEDPRAAAVREVREETQLVVEIEELIDVWAEPPALGGATLVIAFRAVPRTGVLRAADDASDAAYFALDALPDLAFRSTMRAIDFLRKPGRLRPGAQ